MLRLNETTGREINLVCLEEFGSRGLVKGSIHLWRRGLKWNALQFKILIMSNLRWSYSVSSQKYSSGVHGAHLKIISSCIVIFPAKKWHSVSQPSLFCLFVCLFFKKSFLKWLHPKSVIPGNNGLMWTIFLLTTVIENSTETFFGCKIENYPACYV